MLLDRSWQVSCFYVDSWGPSKRFSNTYRLVLQRLERTGTSMANPGSMTLFQKLRLGYQC